MAKRKLIERIEHTPEQKLAVELHELYQDMLQSLASCLETGSHERNNAAAKEFYDRYKWFCDDMHKLGGKIDAALPENY